MIKQADSGDKTCDLLAYRGGDVFEFSPRPWVL